MCVIFERKCLGVRTSTACWASAAGCTISAASIMQLLCKAPVQHHHQLLVLTPGIAPALPRPGAADTCMRAGYGTLLHYVQASST
jgi:hypothetical protein